MPCAPRPWGPARQVDRSAKSQKTPVSTGVHIRTNDEQKPPPGEQDGKKQEQGTLSREDEVSKQESHRTRKDLVQARNFTAEETDPERGQDWAKSTVNE